MNLGCASARFSSPAPCQRLRRPGGHSCSGHCPPTPPATTLIISRQLIPSEPRHRQAELPGEGQPTAPQHWVTRGAGRGFRSHNHLAVPCSAPPAPHAAPSRPLRGRTRPRWPAGDRALPSLFSANFYTTWHPPKAFCRLALSSGGMSLLSDRGLPPGARKPHLYPAQHVCSFTPRLHQHTRSITPVSPQPPKTPKRLDIPGQEGPHCPRGHPWASPGGSPAPQHHPGRAGGTIPVFNGVYDLAAMPQG